MAAFEIYHAHCTTKSKLGYKEEVKDKCDRSHDHQLMKSVKEHTVCHTPCVQGNVVADHGVNHKKYHDKGKDNFLKFVFWHKKSSFKMIK